MPTYGYRCQSCEREFDVWQRMTDESKASCPTCGGSGKRLFFPAGLVFKGSGFYVTDNRRGAGSNGSSSSASKDSASKDSANKDSKSTSKPDSGSSSSGSTAGTSAGNASSSTSE